ncbi:MAG: hypothetical protein Q8K32_33210 [Archangium sp.]|nr:hypothetical protein [Archangium sp.]
MSSLDVAQRITRFLVEFGIPCSAGVARGSTFLPGVWIEAGGVRWDPQVLAWPGDLLHEAGHLATLPPSMRKAQSGTLVVTPADEMAAIAWSWAARARLGLEPGLLFHSGGYKGGSESLLASFATRQPVGVPLLAWYGMTTVEQFPVMTTWLRPREAPTE